MKPIFCLCDLIRADAFVTVDDAGLRIEAPRGYLTSAIKTALEANREALQHLVLGRRWETYRWSAQESRRMIDATVATVAAIHTPGSYDGFAFRLFDERLLNAMGTKDLGQIEIVCAQYLLERAAGRGGAA